MAVILRTTETMDTVGDFAGITEGHDSLASMVVYQLFGTWAGTVTFQATIDNSNYTSVRAEDLSTGTLV